MDCRIERKRCRSRKAYLRVRREVRLVFMKRAPKSQKGWEIRIRSTLTQPKNIGITLKIPCPQQIQARKQTL
jgi:hypothetical protein